MWHSDQVFVIYDSDIEKLKIFLESFGIVFQQEQHGSGPVHYASQVGDKVLEIYPKKEKSVKDARSTS